MRLRCGPYRRRGRVLEQGRQQVRAFLQDSLSRRRGEQGLTKSSKIQTSDTTTTEFYGQTQCDYADRVHLSQLPNENVEDDEPRKSQAYIHYLWDKCSYCEDWKFGDEGNIFVKFGGEAAKVKGNVAIFTVPALQANVLANTPVSQSDASSTRIASGTILRSASASATKIFVSTLTFAHFFCSLFARVLLAFC